jgi:hypothetical protein
MTMTTEQERAAAAEQWHLISIGALPPAVAISRTGAPAWDLSALVEWFSLPLDVVRQALAVKASASAAEAAQARQAPPPPDRNPLKNESLKAPTRGGTKWRAFSIKPQKSG